MLQNVYVRGKKPRSQWEANNSPPPQFHCKTVNTQHEEPRRQREDQDQACEHLGSGKPKQTQGRSGLLRNLPAALGSLEVQRPQQRHPLPKDDRAGSQFAVKISTEMVSASLCMEQCTEGASRAPPRLPESQVLLGASASPSTLVWSLGTQRCQGNSSHGAGRTRVVASQPASPATANCLTSEWTPPANIRGHLGTEGKKEQVDLSSRLIRRVFLVVPTQR